MKALLRAVDRGLAFAAARRGRPASGPLPAPGDLRHVLIVRLDSAGDLVLTSPLLRELRRNVPQARVTLAVRPALLDLAAACPHIDAAVAWEGADLRPRSALRAWRHAKKFAAAHWPDAPFDLALLPRWEDDGASAALLAMAARARCRVGYHERPLLTQVCPDGPARHEVQRSLDVLRWLGGRVDDDRLELWIADADRQAASALLAAQGAGPSDVVVAVAPGAGSAHRRWPAGRFAAVAEWCLATRGGWIVVVGDEEDRAAGELIAARAGARVINAAGRVPLRVTAALLERSVLFIGNDSGPMHLAAAAGTPVVEVSCHPQGGAPGHHNAPERFGPWRVPHVVVRPDAPEPPCRDGCDADDAHCIARIPVQSVIDAVSALQPRHPDPA